MGEIIYFKRPEKSPQNIAIDEEQEELNNFFAEFIVGFEERGYDVVEVSIAPRKAPPRKKD